MNNCSDFDGHYGSEYPLVECPPAKFMLKDNLVECFVLPGCKTKQYSNMCYQ